MKPVATNKKAYQNYHLSEKLECGVALTGGEVKSVRAGEVNFQDAYAMFNKHEELYLHNMHINPYKEASYLNDVPNRARKLLLHKKELQRFWGLMTQKNLTIVPTKIYLNNRGLVKVEIAVAQGKKQYDRRDDIKKREVRREVDRALKERRR